MITAARESNFGVAAVDARSTRGSSLMGTIRCYKHRCVIEAKAHSLPLHFWREPGHFTEVVRMTVEEHRKNLSDSPMAGLRAPLSRSWKTWFVMATCRWVVNLCARLTFMNVFHWSHLSLESWISAFDTTDGWDLRSYQVSKYLYWEQFQYRKIRGMRFNKKKNGDYRIKKSRNKKKVFKCDKYTLFEIDRHIRQRRRRSVL